MEKNEEKGIFSKTYNWFANLTVKGLLGAILVAFIILIILVSVSYIPGVMSRISNSLSAALYSIFVPAENATLTINKNIINSGEDFTINFKRGDMTDGLFTVSYSCDSNQNINLVSVETNGFKAINCDTPYYLLDNETSITIRPSTNESVVRLVMTGSFENNSTQKSEVVGVARITIKNDSVGVIAVSTTTSSNNTTSTQNTYSPTVTYPTYYGKADLAIRVIQVGLLNSQTNLITTQNQFRYSDMVGIKFEVRNDGETATGPWNFTAVLPSLSTPTYNSNTQISLRPGESIIFTLGFSNLNNQYSNIITINVDPQNQVSESVEYNNIITSTITNLTYNINYNNTNYNYNTGYNNGCYVNGFFTYNCDTTNSNYYDGYGNFISYNNNYYYNNLSVSCSVSPNNPETGDRVRWSADSSGGDEDYDYKWTGTNGLDSSSKNPIKTYTSSGWKYATVTVTDGDNYKVSQTCSVYVN